MANRFPLVIDTEGTAQIKEIPAGDNLDFTSVGISNLTSLSVAGSLSGGSLTITGNTTLNNASIGGTLGVSGAATMAAISATSIDASSFTVSGQPLSSIQVQSDWNVSNSADPAFIRNKPSFSTVVELDDLADVNIVSLLNGQVLAFDGPSGEWRNTAPSGGISLTSLSVISNPASGNGSLVYDNSTGVFEFTPANVPTLTSQLTNDASFTTLAAVASAGYLLKTGLTVSTASPAGNGSLSYNDTNGIFSFTPALVPTAVSQLSNDANYTTLAAVDSAGYLLDGDVLSTGRITRTVAGGQVTLGFDDVGLLTAEVDNLQSVTDRSNVTTNTITAASFDASDLLGTSNFQALDAVSITFGTLSSTNGNITLTNGSITTTTGNINTNIITATELISPDISNTGDVTISPSNGFRTKLGLTLNMAWNVVPDAIPQVGDIWHNGETLAVYVKDDGLNGGSPDNPAWIYFGAGAPRGFLLPIFDTAGRNALTPAPGETILNVSTQKLEIWNGSSWLVVGP
jgi:hypothetical protein